MCHRVWFGLVCLIVVCLSFCLSVCLFFVCLSVCLFVCFDLLLPLPASTPSRPLALWKAFIRFAKLFVIGLLTQGGINIMAYDLSQIRVMGILQRVALCYIVAALCEILLPRVGDGGERYRERERGAARHEGVLPVSLPLAAAAAAGRPLAGVNTRDVKLSHYSFT